MKYTISKICLIKTFAVILMVMVFSCKESSNDPKANTEKITDINTLRAVYKDVFKIGTAVNPAIISGKDSLSQAILLNDFNAMTPENCMKAEKINPEPGIYNFENADKYVAFGKKHGFFIMGHTLIWHNQTPEWFFKDDEGNPKTPAEQKEQLRSHIETIAGRYLGKVNAWDVVNEVINDDGAYRPTKWVEGIGNGDELVKLAFQYASEYAPDTELYYNDFNAWRPEKRDGIVRMVKMLQAEGIRIDGIGMQAHWGLNYPKNEYIEEAVDAYAELGIKVMITELDIDVLPFSKEGQLIGQNMMEDQFQLEEFENYLDPYQDGLPKEIEEKLAMRYAELFQLFNRKKNKIDRVTFWGIHDGMSWKNGYPIPGRTNYPLLYDRDRKPKMARQAIINAIKE